VSPNRTVIALCVAGALALVASSAAGAQAQKSLTAQEGDVSASLTWTELDYGRARNVHLTIVRAGATLVDEDLPPLGSTRAAGRTVAGDGYADVPEALTVRDLDGNDEPEVIADLYTGGAHCCSYSRIYRYPDLGGTGYESTVQPWGNVGYSLKDLDGDGLPEFRSADDRFAYAFSCFACSGFPIQIWQFRGGDFVPEMQDVTRSFPLLIQRDSVRWWKAYVRERRHHGDVRGLVAAWAADQYQLQHQDKVAFALRGMVERHELNGFDGGTWPAGRTYVRKLKAFLRANGYDKLPA
jgi:hypothetical protein